MQTKVETKENTRLEIGVLYGFRALMVLFVVNFHLWQQGWLPQRLKIFDLQISLDYFTRSSYLFVDGMMLLTGFLLFLPYARQKRERISILSVKNFYLNRLIRIVPSYLFSVLLILFCFVIPQGRYGTVEGLVQDLLARLSFTFTFFPKFYMGSQLNGVLWTAVIEMQFYLIFPWIARLVQKKPALVLSCMAILGWIYRAVVYFTVADTSMFINQMPAFLDVYALGMLGAMLYCRMRDAMENAQTREKLLYKIAALLIFIASIIVVLQLLGMQSKAGMVGHAELRLSQLSIRLPFSLALLISMLAAAYMPRAMQWLLSNRLMRFLATISFNLYIWHQFIGVEIAKGWYPNTLHYDFQLQLSYIVLCYSLSILVAMAVTFGIEKPAAKLLNQFITKSGGKNKHERSTSGQIEPPAHQVLL